MMLRIFTWAFTCHLPIYFGKVIVDIFFPNFTRLFFFYWVLRVLYIFQYKLFIRLMFCRYFLSGCSLFFIFLGISLKSRLFFFDAQFIIFFCIVCALSKKALAHPGSQRFSPMFSYRLIYSFSSYV